MSNISITPTLLYQPALPICCSLAHRVLGAEQRNVTGRLTESRRVTAIYLTPRGEREERTPQNVPGTKGDCSGTGGGGMWKRALTSVAAAECELPPARCAAAARSAKQGSNMRTAAAEDKLLLIVALRHPSMLRRLPSLRPYAAWPRGGRVNSYEMIKLGGYRLHALNKLLVYRQWYILST